LFEIKKISFIRGLGNELLWAVSLALLIIAGGTLFFVSLFLIVEAYPALLFKEGLIDFLFRAPWSPLTEPATFGIVHAWISTIIITGASLFIAIPIGFGIGLFLSDIAPVLMKMMLRPALDLLAGIPAVVYGFFGYVTILPFFEKSFDMPTGESALAASLILAVMVLPYIASTSAEAFLSVPADVREAAFAQGVTRLHVIRRVVFVWAAPGMFAAVALGLARAIGETLAVLMLAGNSLAIPTSMLDRAQPLTGLIATELGEAGVGSDKYHALFAAGLFLMALIVLINLIIWIFKRRLLTHV